MRLARFPFTIVELPATDVFDAGLVDERPTTRPAKGGFRKVRGPRRESHDRLRDTGPARARPRVPAGEIELEAAEITTTEAELEPIATTMRPAV